LTVALVTSSLTRQPAKRLVIAWATALSLGLLLGLVTIPGWSLWSLAGAGTASANPSSKVPSPATVTPPPVPKRTPVLPAVDFPAEPERIETAVTLPAGENASVDLAHAAAKLLLPLYLGGTLLATGWLLVGWWLAR